MEFIIITICLIGFAVMTFVPFAMDINRQINKNLEWNKK